MPTWVMSSEENYITPLYTLGLLDSWNKQTKNNLAELHRKFVDVSLSQNNVLI